jgi:hypothetical protein
MSMADEPNDDATLLIITCPCSVSSNDEQHFRDEAEAIKAIFGQSNCEIMCPKHPDDVYTRINREGSRISKVHFIGNGDLTVDAAPGLAFPKQGGEPGYVEYKIEDYVKKVFFRERGSLDLIFLSGSETNSLGEPLHINENAKCVICWSTRAQIDAAKELAVAFYTALKNPIQLCAAAPAEKQKTWSGEQQCHAAFHAARAELSKRWNLALNPDSPQFHPQIHKTPATATTKTTRSDGSVAYQGSTVVKPKKEDSQKRRVAGRPRILPSLPAL